MARWCLAAQLYIHSRDVVVVLGAVAAVGGPPSPVPLLAPACSTSPPPRLTVSPAQRAVPPLAHYRRCLGCHWVVAGRVAVVVVVGVGVRVGLRCLRRDLIAVRRPLWIVGLGYIDGRRAVVMGGWLGGARYLCGAGSHGAEGWCWVCVPSP